MAIERNVNSISLKLTSNYGTIDGKTVRKSKSYSSVKSTATDAQIIATGKAIDNLVITFKQEADNTYSMTIPDYKDAITDTEILAGAQAIITQNIFAPDGLDFIGVLTAKRVDTTTTEVEIPEA